MAAGMQHSMFSLLENRLAWCGYQDSLQDRYELLLSMSGWLREYTLCRLGSLQVSGQFPFLPAGLLD